MVLGGLGGTANLRSELTLNTRNFEGGIKRARGGLQSFSDGLRRHRTTILAFTGALTGIGVFSIKAASDLVEAQNASNQVFGKSISIIEEFAEKTAIAYGVSRRAAFEYAGTLGGIAIASGLSSDAAANMSVDVIKLAGDLASMKNLSIEEALLKMQAGLVGEVEPLRRVGVLLSAVAVETKAMELGLAGANGELSEGAKVQARYALISETLTSQGVVGDAIRTQGEFAGQLRLLRGQLENTAATVGDVVLPIATKFLNVISTLFTAITKLPEPVLTFVVVLGAVAAAFGAVLLVLPFIISGITALTAAMALFGIVSNVALLGIPVAVALIVAGIALLVLKWDEVSAFFQTKAGIIVAALFPMIGIPLLIAANFETLKEAARTAFNFIIEKIQTAVEWLNAVIGGFNKVSSFLGQKAIPQIEVSLTRWEKAAEVTAEAVVDGNEQVIGSSQAVIEANNDLAISAESTGQRRAAAARTTAEILLDIHRSEAEGIRQAEQDAIAQRIAADVAEHERRTAAAEETAARLQMITDISFAERLKRGKAFADAIIAEEQRVANETAGAAAAAGGGVVSASFFPTEGPAFEALKKYFGETATGGINSSTAFTGVKGTGEQVTIVIEDNTAVASVSATVNQGKSGGFISDADIDTSREAGFS